MDESRPGEGETIGPARGRGAGGVVGRRGGGEVLNEGEAAEVVRLAGGLATSGMAMPGGLRALADEAESGRVRRGLRRLADRVERGESLGEAMAGEGRGLPEYLVGVVRAAERSGRLPEVLAESARFERIGDELRRHLLIRLAYPTLLLCAFAALFQLISHVVTQDLADIFSDFGVNLPRLTIWLIACSRFVVDSPWVVPTGIGTAAVLVWLAARGASRSARRRMTRGIPMLGTLWRYAAMAEFASLLALLVECRLPMPEALRLSGRGVRDPALVSACDGASGAVEEGRSLADAARSFRLFPSRVDRLLAWAEPHGALPDALRLASETFEARARAQAVLIGLFASTAMVTLVVLGVILTVVGLYLPMLRLFFGLTGMPVGLW